MRMRRRHHDPIERVWNPYSWRLREIATLGPHPSRMERAGQLTAELITAEAVELARGIRHLSVVHGDPATPRESEELDTFLGRLDALSRQAEWSRIRGDFEHVIVAVGGQGADDRVAEIRTLVDRSNPGHWLVVDSARPPLPPLP
jgi:hypothetical protein